jgi:hypothetical protein
MSVEIALDDLFEDFHRNNPEVYVELVALARRWKERGFKKCGIGMLWEVLRWQRLMRDVHDGLFKLNNSYRSRYARLIMDTEPDLAGFFNVRGLRT